ncbi:hypothetical protein A2690_04600 [Candidatus Roizmanbacteria bacterium RIFCSPHIGHO2_01_FULL_39_12b]|uniref:Peptidase M50 domain-containing protein n=1 Tax=Candidatus Roizmanbacteria bacterium RIFCSPHIGHO2_01_FULL_39_12b TaxID=1802030 RepID=A0A1F7G7P2_9BACT|nr:MAG: hypothetical protein A2690_04600 [Candidatus Roizmanbacteria bacterium RIFCSPHIGHO2_01_FULL_39_12b]
MTIILFITILSLLILIHEFGHFIVAKKNGILVEEFGLGLPPRIFGVKIGETFYSLNILPIGGFVKVLGEEEAEKASIPKKLISRTFYSKRPLVKAGVVIAGVACNFLLGWMLISYLFTKGVPVPSTRVVVEKVEKNSPAALAGLKEGDKLIELKSGNSSEKLNSNEKLIKLTDKFAGAEIAITFKRGALDKTLMLTPRKNPPKGEGPLGIVLKPYEIKKYSITQAPFYGLYHSTRITGTVAKELLSTAFKFLTLQKTKTDVAGPVGIAILTREAARSGLDPLLQLIAILSLNLAVINIFPFPALDGGRLVMIVYEGVTKRKINPNIERRLNIAGFAILLSLILVVTISDLIKVATKTAFF